MTPKEIKDSYSEVGKNKSNTSCWKLFVLSILAGMFIAFGALGSSIASCGISGPIGRLLSAIIFPIGLVMVLIAGSELFTGDCLMIISVLDKKINIWNFIKCLLIVYIGNFIGGIIVSLLATYGHIFSLYNNGLAKAVIATAATKCNISFLDAFIKGILCNILVCIAVWMSFSTNDTFGKIIACYLPVLLFVLCGFEHCVANFYFIPAGLFASYEYDINVIGLSWLGFLKNEIPVTLGNIIGGILIGILYWVIYSDKKIKLTK